MTYVTASLISTNPNSCRTAIELVCLLAIFFESPDLAMFGCDLLLVEIELKYAWVSGIIVCIRAEEIHACQTREIKIVFRVKGCKKLSYRLSHWPHVFSQKREELWL